MRRASDEIYYVGSVRVGQIGITPKYDHEPFCKDCFEKMFIISPTIQIDKSWEPVKKYITDKLKVNPEKEHCAMDHYDHKKIDEIVEVQERVSDYMNENNYKSVYQILIGLDDVPIIRA